MPRTRRIVAGLLAVAGVALVASAPAGARTTWLCRPGLAANPCTPGLATTVYSPTGQVLRVEHPRQVARPRFDCFYVYPTVSQQSTLLASFAVDPEERSIATAQAARYSQYCRVYAPMYRQLTLRAILQPAGITAADVATVSGDVRSAFADYLKHDNRGRPFVLIGHSQGADVLRQLIAADVDLRAAVRRRLLSAILLGGDVTVAAGRGVGGDFQHVSACGSARQLGCVIAWSTFDTPVLPSSLFGRTATPGRAVLCTNPAALSGGTGIVNLIVPGRPGAGLASSITIPGLPRPAASTPWVAMPGAYRAGCSSANGANVLQITSLGGAPTLPVVPDATWGLHLYDANIGLGNLLAIVQAEAAAYFQHHRA